MHDEKTTNPLSQVNPNIEGISSETAHTQILEYNLKVEEHADKFFEMRHKITFFLITASVGSIAYTLNFSIGRFEDIKYFPERKVCLIVAAFTSLITVALSLMSMYYDVCLNRLNLMAYFERKLYEDLKKEEQNEWESASTMAKRCEKLSFTFLAISIVYQSVLFILFLF